MQSFNMKHLNALGINCSAFECVEFISMILLVKSEIYNRKITELFDVDDIESIVFSLDIWLNEGLENAAYDFIKEAKVEFDCSKVPDLLEYYEKQVKKYITPSFDALDGKDVKFDDILTASQNCQNLCLPVH